MIEIEFYRKQAQFFFELEGKYKILTKGRRVGGTQGMAHAFIDMALKDAYQKFMWVDVTQANLNRYVERYFFPKLKHLDSKYWKWRAQQYELSICDTVIDFRSAERPENIEGQGYHKIGLNEAGIILKGDRGRYLWFNAILPMLSDYQGSEAFFVGTPKGRTDKDGSDCLYYELAKRAMEGEKNYSIMNIETSENPYLDQEAVAEVIAELPEGPIRDQEAYGKFVDAGAGIIKREWLRVDDIPISGDKIIGVDLAVSEKTSADDTALVMMVRGENNRYQIQDVESFKETWPNAKPKIMSFIERHKCKAIIESNAQMIGLIDDLRREQRMQNYTIEDRRTTKDKLACASPWISRLESGQLTLLRAAWNNAFIAQAVAFTVEDKGRTDDMLDGTSRCWEGFNGSKELSISFM